MAEFCSQMSHELKTPLAIMRGECELILRSEGKPTEEYRDVIRLNLEEIIRMSKIIEDLVLLTKLEAQHGVVKFQEFDIVGFLREMTESIEALAESKDLKHEIRLPSSPIRIKGDPVHLRKVFFSLVHNAVKFTPPGGHILVEAVKKGKTVIISVSDTGIGISAENQSRVFDKFFHFEKMSELPPGNGLGLSIAQSIIKIHAGEVLLHSATGKGSVFSVQLPVLR